MSKDTNAIGPEATASAFVYCWSGKRRSEKNESQRTAADRDLIKLAGKTVGYATTAIPLAKGMAGLAGIGFCAELERHIDLVRKVIAQTERRVLKGESVPAAEKIVPIFEPHTDIIVKDRRDTYYGHKVCLCVGASNFITDCMITDGNPADTQLTLTMLDRQQKICLFLPLIRRSPSQHELLSVFVHGLKPVREIFESASALPRPICSLAEAKTGFMDGHYLVLLKP